MEIDGFRCFNHFEISFEDDLTIIVGENDAGKTSLLDCIKVLTHNKPVERDDFSYGKNELKISITIEDYVFEKEYKLEGDEISENIFIAKPTIEYIQHLKELLHSEDFDLEQEDSINLIKNTAKTFGLTVRTTSRIDNLHQNLLE